MAANKKINLSAPNLLTVNSKIVEKAFRNAARAALLKNKTANNPVAVWRKGKITLISPEEMSPDKI